MKHVFSILIIVSLIYIVTASYAQEETYDRFYDSYGESRLVSKNNDVYVHTIDGSRSKQITHTPDTEEDSATFSKDGKHIAYSEYLGKRTGPDGQSKGERKHYKVEVGCDDNARMEISAEEMENLKNEREGYR